ncbi:CRISPR-associated endonuclease Cas2 [Blastochloris viridis]|uniref:CRISPR-associated endoribonuclease Cas2 n=1 Tax=Blastochloris viridis TaxID=1079 RepID=A0A0H5BQC7_BLAVI|nr:CRISPR-associated endonuclease Cas2 [Blastochloris viridis]ALK09401.1 CRISPR-associated endoribonuclease Cas2 [Blastochloris viridis]ALK09855.1 CRISPR-associated endoribonuclease Cas2 [Blastochloris viridis]CUU42064.1 CRISPR-associated endoribonuclease Cas2 [Blastochloris viridis]CUU42518.1 CRISPR-associated endoribonuclease Cas2 [Blastochloris viridis]BAS00240.1 CRISPR-associated protein Cas2 [Blastochloris viridis]
MARRSNAEHAYVVAYDISDPKRWRRVFKTMKGYGRWLQLSVFHCRLDGGRRAEMASALEDLIDRDADHVIILDLGPAEDVEFAVESLGKSFQPIERRAVVI